MGARQGGKEHRDAAPQARAGLVHNRGIGAAEAAGNSLSFSNVTDCLHGITSVTYLFKSFFGKSMT
jgi:hypothetical protein